MLFGTIALVLLVLLALTSLNIVTKTYTRPKAAATNSTGMAIHLQVAEGAGVPTELLAGSGDAGVAAAAGLDGNLHAKWQADVTEGGGTSDSLKTMYLLDTVLTMGTDVSAKANMFLTLTPVNGDGTQGTPLTISLDHPQTMDAFQTTGGRVRQ